MNQDQENAAVLALLVYYIEIIPMRISDALVLGFRQIRDWLGWRTYQLESAIVLTVLVMVALVSQKGWVEWVGVLAVWLTFKHASVSDRMAEKEGLRAERGEENIVECYQWERRYFLGKEVTWFIYFIALQAWSALVGVGVFLAYRGWRKAYRKHYPAS